MAVNPKNKWLLGTVAAVTISTVAMLEGRRNDPYQDIVGVWTVCDGETNVAMRRYSNAECDAMLRKSLVKYGDGVLQCIDVPITLKEHAAYTSFAYHVGVSAFCASKNTVIGPLNRGDHRAACDGMTKWYLLTKNGALVDCRLPVNKCKGIPDRRKIEQSLCLAGLV